MQRLKGLKTVTLFHWDKTHGQVGKDCKGREGLNWGLQEGQRTQLLGNGVVNLLVSHVEPQTAYLSHPSLQPGRKW